MRPLRLKARARALLVVCALLVGCDDKGPPPPAGKPVPEAQRFHLGTHTRKVSTLPAAQAAFDRGLTLSYAFSHGAAEAAFREAAAADPSCAMAWWGVALVNGPHINFPVVLPPNAATAWDALGKARALGKGAGPADGALIDALVARYANPQPESRRPLDESYAAAMRGAWKAHPNDADVGCLFAEALLDLRPWDYWQADGKPYPETAEALTALEAVRKLSPRHPGAHHLLIHVVEAHEPARAVASADLLRDLVPGAGHLVHMPAHIYARVGRWEDAALANTKATEADAWFRQAHPRPGLYALYMAHNHHFFAWGACMQGQSARALKSAREMVAGIPPEFLEQFAPIADGFLAFPAEVLMRFGKWEEILREPEPKETFPVARALRHFTRGVALTALGRMGEADEEDLALAQAGATMPQEATFGNNPGTVLVGIALLVLHGEIHAKKGQREDALKDLRLAVEMEDLLRYDEPPDWIQPVRHTLGAVLLAADRPEEAEAVYRADLAKWPENGWALFGLSRALHLQGKHVEMQAVETLFKRAWAGSDVTLTSTCFCQPGK
jgi:tetratricopeptide (TPR) repeat protein